jgi:hypothetical protein
VKEEKEDYDGIAPIQSVMKKMKKEYDKNPKDWRIIGAKDKDGNADTFITKKPNAFWLKSKQLSPFTALSMGTIVKKIDQEIDEQIGKTMTQEDIMRLFGMVVPVKPDKSIIAAGIEKFSQSHGDYLKKIISEQNGNLGYQMAKRIDKEFIRKYPQRKNLYI